MEAVVLYRRQLFFYFHFDAKLKTCVLNLAVARELPVYHHDQKLAVYRMHANSLSSDKKQMLQTMITVLEKQRPFLKNNEERAALQQGLQNWPAYYNP